MSAPHGWWCKTVTPSPPRAVTAGLYSVSVVEDEMFCVRDAFEMIG